MIIYRPYKHLIQNNKCTVKLEFKGDASPYNSAVKTVYYVNYGEDIKDTIRFSAGHELEYHPDIPGSGVYVDSPVVITLLSGDVDYFYNMEGMPFESNTLYLLNLYNIKEDVTIEIYGGEPVMYTRIATENCSIKNYHGPDTESPYRIYAKYNARVDIALEPDIGYEFNATSVKQNPGIYEGDPKNDFTWFPDDGELVINNIKHLDYFRLTANTQQPTYYVINFNLTGCTAIHGLTGNNRTTVIAGSGASITFSEDEYYSLSESSLTTVSGYLYDRRWYKDGEYWRLDVIPGSDVTINITGTREQNKLTVSRRKSSSNELIDNLYYYFDKGVTEVSFSVPPIDGKYTTQIPSAFMGDIVLDISVESDALDKTQKFTVHVPDRSDITEDVNMNVYFDDKIYVPEPIFTSSYNRPVINIPQFNTSGLKLIKIQLYESGGGQSAFYTLSNAELQSLKSSAIDITITSLTIENRLTMDYSIVLTEKEEQQGMYKSTNLSGQTTFYQQA